MKASEIIQKLNFLKEKYGDREVYIGYDDRFDKVERIDFNLVKAKGKVIVKKLRDKTLKVTNYPPYVGPVVAWNDEKIVELI